MVEPNYIAEYNEVLEGHVKAVTYRLIKRTFDVILSILGLIISTPIIMITCLLVVIDSKGSPILVQERLGKGGRKFNIYKIRSMYTDAEKLTGPKWADVNDNRVTKIGRLIRKTHIDELPQLLNILKGDMSIVGPRPERLFFYEKYKNSLLGFAARLCVKPGLTGLAQVNGGYDLSVKEKLKYDLEYIKKQSIFLDTLIFFKTMYVVLKGDGAR